MKVLVTSDTYMPSLGGAEYHVFYLLKELQKINVECSLFSTEKGKHLDDALLHVTRHPFTGIASIPSIFLHLWKCAENADIIHAHYSYRLGFLSGLVAFLQRKPFVVTQHGLGLLPQAGAKLWQKIPFKLWRYWSMKWADRIISTSEDLSIDIRVLGFGEKIFPITNGYDDALFMPLEAPVGPPTILAVRRHVPKNGIQYLIAALPEIIQAVPNVQCVLVGEGRLHQDLKNLAKQLSVESRVQFLGPKEHAELRELYTAAHAVIIPSTAESTSLSCIEAMAQMKPIIASRVGGLIELLGKNQERGYLVSLTDTEHCNYEAQMSIAPEKISQLAQTIVYVLTHPEEAMSKAKMAAEYAKMHCTWSTLAEKTLLDVYLPLLSHGNHTA